MQKPDPTLVTSSVPIYVEKSSHIKVPCSNCNIFSPASMAICPHDQEQLDQNAPHFDNGSMLFPLLSVLGEGGMGTVYKATHPGLDKIVAIKVIHQADALSVKRFQLEARALSRLNHKNLISVFDFGVSEGGLPFMVMEFADGCTLAQYNQTTPGLTIKQIVRTYRDLASGLSQVHSLGLIHRDLKPDNIVMAKESNGVLFPKLIDFGIAKSVHESRDNERLTMTGTIVGSPIYMSPEQCCGEELNHFTDIYSFGCMLFESISGEPPFRGKHFMETISHHVNTSPPELYAKSELAIDLRLSDLVYCCLEKKPADRPQSMEEIVAALSAIERVSDSTQSLVNASYREPELGHVYAPEVTQLGVRRDAANSAYLLESGVLEDSDDSHIDDDDESVGPGRNFFKLALLTFSALLVTLGLVFALIQFSTRMALPLQAKVSPVLLDTKHETLSSFGEESVQMVSQKWIESRIDNKQLDLSRRYCVDDGTLKILLKAKHIEMLNLQDDAVTDEGTKYFLHLPLQVLNLRGTGISDRAIGDLAKVKTIRVLDLSSTAVTASGVSRLSSMSRLAELYLHGCVLLTDDVGVALSRLSGLECVDLSKTKIGDAALKPLGGISHLKVLDISNTAITDAGFEYLVRSPIRDLNAANLRITGSSVKSLKQMRQLRKLNISGCYSLGLSDARALEAAIPNCQVVRYVRGDR